MGSNKKPFIYISNYPFARVDKEPLNVLQQTGWEIRVNDKERKLTPEELVEAALEVDGLVAGTENLRPLVESSKSLKMISRIGIGLDRVPLELCRKKGISVSYTPDAVTTAVVEYTIGAMVALSRRFLASDRELREGGWGRPFGPSIEGSTIGIVGLGRVGFGVAKRLVAFSPKEVLINDIADVSKKIDTLQGFGLNVRRVSADELFAASDWVTLHVPLSRTTRNLAGGSRLTSMKKGSFLINTSRGGVVNEADLLALLETSSIGGAALDVFEKEPYRGDLVKLENVLLTQHIGSCTYGGRREMELGAALEIVRFFRGEALQTAVPESEYEYQRENE